MNYGLSLFVIVCLGAVAFFLKFLLEVWSSRRRSLRAIPPGKGKRGTPGKWAAAIAVCVFAGLLHAQTADTAQAASGSGDTQAMQTRIDKLAAEVAELKAMVRALQPAAINAGQSDPDSMAQASPQPQKLVQSPLPPEDRSALNFLRETTINLGIDGYFAYNFNHPVGRVNLLRAYDVLSNEFSLNQASVILEHAPDVSAGRRFGARLDLQFGQATDTLQGNPLNEPRPQIYRNIFQAYGTYIVAVGKGVNLDVGKWSSSLGIEGNYSKDQLNYSRAFWFNFLPFYHMGLRASIPLTNRFSLNYWLVNGTNQVEATNGFKDQLFGFTARPAKSVNWTANYYFGQEHPDRAPSDHCGPVPVQPGLCFTAIRPAPDGRTHIFDSYATWQATPKLTLALEGDYFLQRDWRHSGPGRNSAPTHVQGGAVYAQYQLTPKLAVATRAEYMADPGGLFSGISQALKENTVTLDYRMGEGLLMRYEWRRDYSNQPSFLSDVQGVFHKQQTTATLGLVWWWGRKEGSW